MSGAWSTSWSTVPFPAYHCPVGDNAQGYVEQLPSGRFRAGVYLGKDPITKRNIYLRATAPDRQQAQIELGKLLEQARAGKEPESGATVGYLLDQYMPLAEWEVSTRETCEGYIRRTIRPALGHLPVRKVPGPVLDKLYGRLKKCSDLTCTGKPFTEHRNVPDLRPSAGDRRQPWEQVAGRLRDAIGSGDLPPGCPLPSVRDLQETQGIRRSTLQRAYAALAEEGLLLVRQGRTATVTGEAPEPEPGIRRWRPGRGHDCALAGCRRHVCTPMKPSTIHQVHSILSGAFDTARRWGWVGFNPADSARPPTVTHETRQATPPADVAKVIAECRAREMHQVALYLWLAAITGGRRGELCAIQVRDVDLEHGLLFIASNYVVKGGQKVRKDTKTHQKRWNALDDASVAFIREQLDETAAKLAKVGLELPPDAYLFSNDPMHATPWNPDWASHKVADLAYAAGVDLNIKQLRHYTASQLLAARFDLRNTAARLGHGGGGATTLKHYADPVSEVDRRAAAYLAELTGAAVPAKPSVIPGG
jgi:integrase